MTDPAAQAAAMIADKVVNHYEFGHWENEPERTAWVKDWAKQFAPAIRAVYREQEARAEHLERVLGDVRALFKDLLSEFEDKHRACVVKTHDRIDSHEWDALMNKAMAYADCEKSLRSVLAILDQRPEDRAERE